MGRLTERASLASLSHLCLDPGTSSRSAASVNLPFVTLSVLFSSVVLHPPVALWRGTGRKRALVSKRGRNLQTPSMGSLWPVCAAFAKATGVVGGLPVALAKTREGVAGRGRLRPPQARVLGIHSTSGSSARIEPLG